MNIPVMKQHTSLMPVNTRPKRMYCHDCREYTESIEPIIIIRYNTCFCYFDYM